MSNNKYTECGEIYDAFVSRFAGDKYSDACMNQTWAWKNHQLEAMGLHKKCVKNLSTNLIENYNEKFSNKFCNKIMDAYNLNNVIDNKKILGDDFHVECRNRVLKIANDVEM